MAKGKSPRKPGGAFPLFSQTSAPRDFRGEIRFFGVSEKKNIEHRTVNIEHRTGARVEHTLPKSCHPHAFAHFDVGRSMFDVGRSQKRVAPRDVASLHHFVRG